MVRRMELVECRKKLKVKEFRCGPEGFRRFRLPNFMTFGTWRWWGCQPHAPAVFTPRKSSWYSFSLGAESTPGPWYGRKECVTEKSSAPPGIDPGTVRLVAQHLNHYTTPRCKIWSLKFTQYLSSWCFSFRGSADCIPEKAWTETSSLPVSAAGPSAHRID